MLLPHSLLAFFPFSGGIIENFLFWIFLPSFCIRLFEAIIRTRSSSYVSKKSKQTKYSIRTRRTSLIVWEYFLRDNIELFYKSVSVTTTFPIWLHLHLSTIRKLTFSNSFGFSIAFHVLLNASPFIVIQYDVRFVLGRFSTR